MRRDHRPYFIKKLAGRFEKFYTNHFVRPQFDSLGRGDYFIKPWHVEIFGPFIEMGDYCTVIATSDNKIRLSVWPDFDKKAYIKIGSYCLICPGVRLGASQGINIGDNCMLAREVYITDSDWHDIYNRISTGKSDPVNIKNNVWIGERAIILKGVTIGENSIVGAGSVVTKDIAENAIAAGNPAKIIKNLDPGKKIITRAQWLSEPQRISMEFDIMDREKLKENSFLKWLRHLMFPGPKD